MTGMLLDVMREVNNFFEKTRECSNFIIENGWLHAKGDYKVLQYIAVTGSLLNDSVYKIIDIEKTDGGIKYLLEGNTTNEQFRGLVWGLAIPQGFISLVREIQNHIDKTPQNVMTSEKFGDYSYTMATDKDGLPVSWNTLFRKRLNYYRKPWTEVRI